jgi:hypothetical protein
MTEDPTEGTTRPEDDDVARTDEEAQAKLEELEKDPPKKLEDWPADRTKYQTLGGTEGTASYDEGPTAKLGPSDLRYHDDGSVTVKGEEVDDPEQYKGDPLPGGPTDPEAPTDPNDTDHAERQKRRPRV